MQGRKIFVPQRMEITMLLNDKYISYSNLEKSRISEYSLNLEYYGI